MRGTIEQHRCCNPLNGSNESFAVIAIDGLHELFTKLWI